MNKKILIVLTLIVVLSVGFYFYRQHQSKPSGAAFQQSAVFVSTQTAKTSTWSTPLQAVGNVRAAKSIEVSTDASGIVDTIAFRSGQQVAAGQILVKLRSDSIKSALDKANIALKIDTKNYERSKTLLPHHYISQSDIDTLVANIDKDKADVKQQQALLAQLEIKAPFSGWLGIRQVELGQYLPAGQAIVDLEALDNVYVDFDVPERYISKVSVNDAITVTVDSYPKKVFTGKVIALAHAIDSKSRTLKVRAQVVNQTQQLLTGMSVNVVMGNQQGQQLIIPQSALNYSPKGTGVYVIDDKNTAHWRPVVVGERQQNLVSVAKGVKAGEKIVIAGQQKLHEGSQIVENNDDLLS